MTCKHTPPCVWSTCGVIEQPTRSVNLYVTCAPKGLFCYATCASNPQPSMTQLEPSYPYRGLRNNTVTVTLIHSCDLRQTISDRFSPFLSLTAGILSPLGEERSFLILFYRKKHFRLLKMIQLCELFCTWCLYVVFSFQSLLCQPLCLIVYSCIL